MASYRLSSITRPIHYDLTFSPNFDNLSFTGRACIDLEITEPTSEIICNASGINITNVIVQLEQHTFIPIKSFKLDEQSQTLSVELGGVRPLGHAQIVFEYSGVLSEELRGFYRIMYTGVDGKHRCMAATQFEATDARRAFPCWDEPNIKATFQITLVVPSDLTAISNMPIEEEKLIGPQRKAVRFTRTPRMSTYLLAFVIGDMSCVEASAHDGTKMRVWATRGKEMQGQLALECAIRLLKFFLEYFNIAFPLPKLDHVALPEFASGAMENWGIITYRETALLYDPQNSAASAHQRIVEVVAHEMAHMWFGNLVTMAWWDDLWLNESFASWVGDKAVDKLYPEWHMWTQFVAHDTNSGLSLDSLENSHPVHIDIKDPAEIREIFDSISYSKGASVLRMLEAFLGEESFRRGLHKYLTDHQYDNANTGDLWRALEEVSSQPVSELMSSWINQSGYPLLHAQNSRINNKTWITVEQRKFSYGYIVGMRIKSSHIWHVPLRVLQKESAMHISKLMTSLQDSFVVEHSTTMTEDWIKLNAGQFGFYRVNYSPDNWTHLQQAVRNRELPTIDRLGLANDCYALQLAGILPATEYLSLIQAYECESDTIVWGDISSSINHMASLLRDESFLPQFEDLVVELYDNILNEVGWTPKKGEGHLETLLRSTILTQSGRYGNRRVLDEAYCRFEKYLEAPGSLTPDLRAAVYHLVAQCGDHSTYKKLWELECATELQEEKMRYLAALANFRDVDLLQETLQRTLTRDVRSQDTVQVINMVGNNPWGRELAWEFIKQNWKELYRRYSGGLPFSRLIHTINNLTSFDYARDVEEFFHGQNISGVTRTIQQSLECIHVNARWLEANRNVLQQWFAQQSRS